MVTLDGKLLGSTPPRSDAYPRVVSPPVQNQGLRDALLVAFPPCNIAAEFDSLLAKLR